MLRCFFWGLVLAAGCCVAAEPVTWVDFTSGGQGWRVNADARVVPSEGCYTLELDGVDPWTVSPVLDGGAFGNAKRLAVTLEAECGHAGSFRLFYAAAGEGFTEERAVDLERDAAFPDRHRGVIFPRGPRMQVRLDPPGTRGRVSLRRLSVVPLVPYGTPVFGPPVFADAPEDGLGMDSGILRIIHDPQRWNALTFLVNGQKMAQSDLGEGIAYAAGGGIVPVSFKDAKVETERQGDGFSVRVAARDEGGAVWRLTRAFRKERDAVCVETSVAVDQERQVVHLPWLTLFSGVGTFGGAKSQALLPGVEYLADEPSSNEKEIRGAAANRRLVARYKVCYPMMALVAGGNWFSAVWQEGGVPVSPFFDSPDRVFNSGGHVFGVWSPAVGDARFEGELEVYGGVTLEAGRTYTVKAWLNGGSGQAVTEACSRYVAQFGLPPLPSFPGGFDAAVRLLSAGWLDSSLREGLTWRHAVWGTSFAPAKAEDVPGYLLWLAAHAPEAALKARLEETARQAAEALPKGSHGIGGISHVRRPTGALLYGDLESLVSQAAGRVRQMARHMPDGRVAYRPGKKDYGVTLGADHCNGLSAISAEDLLLQATLTGDEAAVADALAVLDRMTAHYAGEVPRGAQPWEMPLHTPDIVASARLVRCYVLGYVLSGRQAYLEQARYWAWTGMTMLYLAPPVAGEVGLYATIGVIGATDWVAPNWIGQPVQWCGLVYRSALEDLARVDASGGGLWRQVAKGITLTGLQMCFPADDAEKRCGLLPDYFLLERQQRDGPAINPGTLQAHVAEAYGKTPMYTVTRLPGGARAHVPGEARAADGCGPHRLKLEVGGWPEGSYRVLLAGIPRPTGVSWRGAEAESRYLEEARALIVTVNGAGLLEVAFE